MNLNYTEQLSRAQIEICFRWLLWWNRNGNNDPTAALDLRCRPKSCRPDRNIGDNCETSGGTKGICGIINGLMDVYLPEINVFY